MFVSNPIQLIISLFELKRARKINFYHNCSAEELSELALMLQVEKIKFFSFKGQITLTNKTTAMLRGSFSTRLIQSCVISLSPVRTKIEKAVTLNYEISKFNKRQKSVSVSPNFDEPEQIYEEVNIGDVMLEALSLEIPLYPKKEGINFTGITITDTGIKPLELTRNNPFVSLKGLK